MSNSNSTSSSSDNSNPWAYSPNKPLALIVEICYFVPLVIHLVLIFTRRARYMIPFFVGVFFECSGFVVRFLGARDQTNSTFASVTTILVVIAPALLAASIYMIYGRLVTLVDVKQYSIVSPRIVTFTFVMFDVVSFVLQFGGAVTSDPEMSLQVQRISIMLLKAGYAIQMGGLGLFLIQASIAWKRVNKAGIVDDRWTGCLRLLFIGTIVIFFRSFYRVLEISIMHNGEFNFPLMEHEALFYIFDPVFIIPICYLFFAIHPSRYLNAEAPQTLTWGNMVGLASKEAV